MTLAATVTVAGAPVAQGQVNFCDAAAAYCTDIHILGRASLASNGTASWKFIPGPGTHTYKAVFQATTQYASSTSISAALSVSGQTNTWSYIVATGERGNYKLSGVVTTVGDPLPGGYVKPITGLINFIDQTEANASLATAVIYPPEPPVEDPETGFSFDAIPNTQSS
ncbi:MAG TPA: Ig-like domain-containing protein, partial [Acidobacteriaceae bacterium]